MDKKQEFKALSLQTKGTELENRLFFAARNLAIEAMLLRLENTLLRKGFSAKCEWRESSFGSPIVNIKMLLNPKAEPGDHQFGECSLYLSRDRIAGPRGLSELYYSLKSFNKTEYWRGRQPAKLLQFRDEVAAMHDSGHLAAEIDKVNYPFEYEHHSSY